VLRKKIGDTIHLTDGKGWYYETEIVELTKKSVMLKVLHKEKQRKRQHGSIHIAIAPTKQMERLEWFVEKATEMGIDTITPLLCQHSERTRLRQDRLEKIAISAMKQSLRTNIPVVNELTDFKQLMQSQSTMPPQRFIAWCGDDNIPPPLIEVYNPLTDAILLIGPEGDFNPKEVESAIAHGFQAVSLGEARLRTETAGLLSVAWMNT
jgi:16S rRNA (uracil1498-N3)-methyltransferase